MAVAAADAPGAAANLLRTRALLREAGLTDVPWRYGRVPKGAGAITTWKGEIVVRPGTTGEALVKYLKHEGRHRLLSPTSPLTVESITIGSTPRISPGAKSVPFS